MSGATDIIREFSIDFDTMKNSWKYTVHTSENGAVITKWISQDDGKMVAENAICIDHKCAELLFATIAKDFESGVF